MLGLMQPQGLMISSILTHAARHHGSGEIVSRTHENTTHRYTWRDVEARSRRLVRVLQKLGVGPGDRVGTLAWNGFRHLEV
ncbi:MAG TPA: AMP-binding protein, partial [Rhodopila sp.]